MTSDYVGEHRTPELNKKTPMLSNRAYDTLKFVVTIVLPAAGALYFALSVIWGLPGADKVVGSIAAINTFFGVVLKASSNSYESSDAKYDGILDVSTRDDGTKTAALVLDNYENPADVAQQKEVLFKVNQD